MAESELFDDYRARWSALYHLPCSLHLSVLDFGKLGEARQVCSDEQMAEALAGYFATTDRYVLARRHPLALFLANPMRYMPLPAETQRELALKTQAPELGKQSRRLLEAVSRMSDVRHE